MVISMGISILIDAVGISGLFITILSIFFQVKPSSERTISKWNMTFIILWLVLVVIGSLNLYYECNRNNVDSCEQSGSIDETINQEISKSNEDDDNSQEDDDEDLTSSLTPEELIEQNLDLILQLKEEYSDTDTVTIENDNNVKFEIYEKAGYIYRDLTKTGKHEILSGCYVPFVKVIILDYFSNEIIYDFVPNENKYIYFAPGNNNKFYGVFFHDDYDIYVTPPIQVVGGDFSELFTINL